MRAPVNTPGRDMPGPVADPDPAMLDPAIFDADPAGGPTAMPAANPAGDAPAGTVFALPRIAADGRTPMHEYAAGFDPSTRRPRVGILVAGIGMNTADSLAAIRALPGPVTLAFSPYAAKPDRLLAAARIAEHEYLLSIPMEPQGFPLNDPDDRHALMSSLPPADNLLRLRWVLSRLAGYVGVTSALGPMRGERLMGSDDQAGPLLDSIATRGLLFIDARPAQAFAGPAWGRSVDLVLDDDPVNEATLAKRLDALTALARDKGSALGLVSLPRPLAVDRIAAYGNTLADKGLALAPVSALVRPPAKPKDQVP